MGLILIALLLPALAGGGLVVAGRRVGAGVAFGVALVAALGSLGATCAAVATSASVDRPWIEALGVHLALGSDSISAPLLVLAAGITVLVVVHGRRHLPTGGPPALYYGLVLLVELGALATFWARDLIVFFVAFEIVLIPMWLLIGRFGDDHSPAARSDAAGRFLLYTALGSSAMLAGILTLTFAAGTSSMAGVIAVGVSPPAQLAAAILLVLGLGVKVPLLPVHTWLPPAHTIAPTGGSVLLAAVLLKMGTYGLIRLPVALSPDGFTRVAPALAVVGAAGTIWGGLVCLVERDLKRLIAYSSIAHMGFVALALGTNTALGVQAALLTNVAHGVVAALLFFVVGGLKQRWGSTDLAVVRPAVREVWPGLGFALIVGLAASLGLPGLATFWGEFLTIVASWRGATGLPANVVAPGDLAGGWFAWVPATAPVTLLRVCAIAAATGAALAAAYALRVARIVWAGDEAPRDRAGDWTWAERSVCLALVAATIVLGLWPALVVPALAIRAVTP